MLRLVYDYYYQCYYYFYYVKDNNNNKLTTDAEAHRFCYEEFQRYPYLLHHYDQTVEVPYYYNYHYQSYDYYYYYCSQYLYC